MILKNKNKNKTKQGFGLLEAIVGVSIISFSLLSLMLVLQFSNKILTESTKSVQSSFLLEEGMEAVKILRDAGWQNNIATLFSGSDYYFYFDGSLWKSTTTNTFIDGVFERKFSLSNVYRNVSDDISVSGTLDGGTKKAIVSVSWMGRTGTSTKSVSAYISDIFAN